MDSVLEFFCSASVWLTMATLLIWAAYAYYLYKITSVKSNHEKLYTTFWVVMATAIVYHIIIHYFAKDAEYDNWALNLLFSLKYSFEMFLTKTVLEKSKIAEVLTSCQWLYCGYSILYGIAVLTSGFIGFHFLSRRHYTRRWLKQGDTERKTHILVGVNDASRCLAKNIENDQIIFVHIPKPEDGWQGLSLWNNIIRIFNERKTPDKYTSNVVLRGDGDMGGIEKWLEKESTSIYLLSENQNENIAALEKLWKKKDLFKCKIYCHARRDDGLVDKYNSYADDGDRVTFIDSSSLAVQLLIKEKEDMLPVNYVKVAKDNDGHNIGYVKSPFNCAVIGFGETGREAMKFLYEFGAFADKNNNKSPFMCHIFDNDLDKQLNKLGLDIRNIRSSEVKGDAREFETYSMDVCTNSFRCKMRELIRSLNYIFVCLGDEDLNVATAINLAQCAVEEDRKTNNICIAVRLSGMSALNKDTIDKANAVYNGCIKVFGFIEDIWKPDIISNAYLDEEARKFYTSYKELSEEHNKVLEYDPEPTWEEREAKLKSKETCYETRCSIRRKRAQDYSNCFHKRTKQILCSDAKMANAIYDTDNGKAHCDGQDSNTGECNNDISKTLLSLAVCEHLRWEASHLMLGYRETSGKTKDLQKLHKCIKPYSDLTSEGIKHFDWLVVKNSLEK